MYNTCSDRNKDVVPNFENQASKQATKASCLQHTDHSLSFFEHNDIPSPSLSKLLSKEEEDLPSNIFNPYPSLLLHGAK